MSARRLQPAAWALAGLVLLGDWDRAAKAADDGPPFRTVALGLCEDYPPNSRTVAAARRDLEAIRRAGGSVMRISFSWLEMEPEPGKVDFSFWDDVIPMAVDEFGLRLIPYVCYTPPWAAAQPEPTVWTSPPKDPAAFGRFVKALVHRYKDRLHSWELWNEPDIIEFWTGTAAQYAALVREGSRAVREEDPGAKVVLGGLARTPHFLRTLLRDEGVSKFVDVINVHAYFETWHEDSLEELSIYLNRVADIVAQYGDHQEIWMAEVGYSNYRPKDSGEVSDRYRARYAYEHTAEFQADALLRSLALILSTGKVDLIAWYRVNDLPVGQDVIGDVNNRYLGVVDLQGRPKPALEGFRRAAELFRGPLRVADGKVLATRPIASRLEAHCFERPDGSLLAVAWQRTSVVGDGRREAPGAEPPRPAEELTLFVPGHRMGVEVERPGRDAGLVESGYRDGGTYVRLRVAQDRALVVRMAPVAAKADGAR